MAQRPPAGHTFVVTITTTLALIDQFSSSLLTKSSATSIVSPDVSENDGHEPSSPSPLPLLSASVASLKAQSTKLSLLTITAPFTPSVVSKVLSTLNESVLPSLITAALLITKEKHTVCFTTEVHSLVRGTLSDLRTLLICAENRGKDGKPMHEMDEGEKGGVTEAVGRVWDSCDALSQVAKEGVAGFVVRKAESWLGLIKDAVRELQDWDPEDEEDLNELFNDALDNHSDEDDDDTPNGMPGDEEVTAKADPKAVLESKTSALRVLTRVPQSVHVVMKQRLQKWRTPQMDAVPEDQRKIVDNALERLESISETVDETVETLYMRDLPECERLLHRVWELTVRVVEGVVQPWDSHPGGTDAKTKEDRYIERALDWIKQVEPGHLSNGELQINGDASKLGAG